jgi:hypothetical protein
MQRFKCQLISAPALILLLAAPLSSFNANSWAATPAASKPTVNAKPQSQLSPEAAKEAANAIFSAIQQRDANKRYNQFSDELKQTSSPAMVLSTLNNLPDLISWTINKVNTGLRSSSVSAELKTAKGLQQVTLVLNQKGLLVAQLFNAEGQPSTKVAEGFVKAISQGQFITARSYMSLDFQKELPPAAVQRKWQELLRETGNFQRIRKVTEAEHTNSSKLVLVETDFNRLSDSLFIIMNAKNQIIGVDFPTDAQPKPVR